MNSPQESTETAASKFGVAEKMDAGRIRVRFERRLRHPIERVWASLVDPDELAKWFPEITLQPWPGGRFEIRFGGRGNCEGPSVVSGRIAHFEPPRLLQCGTMRWELEPDANGCILRFSDVVAIEGERGERETAKSVLGGWHWYLDALEEALSGRPVDRAKPEVEYEGRVL